MQNNDENNQNKDWYKNWAKAFQLIINDKNTDPIIRYRMLRKVLESLVDYDYYFSTVIKKIELEIPQKEIETSSNRIKSRGDEMKHQRTVASEFFTKISQTNFFSQIDKNTVFPIRPKNINSAFYVWIGWIAQDEDKNITIKINPQKIPEEINKEEQLFIFIPNAKLESYIETDSGKSHKMFSLGKLEQALGKNMTIDWSGLPDSVGYPVYVKNIVPE